MIRKRILVVDDDMDIQGSLCIRLRSYGYEVACASDAVMALPMVKKTRPDLIILDIGLPGGDGFLVLDRLHTQPAIAMIPVLVLTGRSETGNKERAYRAGASAFMQKPVDNEELKETIETLLVGESVLEED